MTGALLYFLVDSLWILDHFYRYSMANFVIMFKKGMDLSGESDDVAQRVRNIIETACYTVFAYVAQGLFERHKLIFATVCSQLKITIRTRLAPKRFRKQIFQSGSARTHSGMLSSFAGAVLPDPQEEQRARLRVVHVPHPRRRRLRRRQPARRVARGLCVGVDPGAARDRAVRLAPRGHGRRRQALPRMVRMHARTRALTHARALTHIPARAHMYTKR